MMRISFLILLFCFSCGLFSQTVTFPAHLKNTSMAQLKWNDSLVYYQCHVEEAQQLLVTASGEKLTGKVQKYTITEKFVVYAANGTYRMKYFTSSLTDFPNKKFAYLKLLEKPYWNFRLEKDTLLNEHDVLIFAVMENKSHDTTEYEFKVNKQNTNEIIIMGVKVMRQLVVQGDHLLKKNLEVLR